MKRKLLSLLVGSALVVIAGGAAAQALPGGHAKTQRGGENSAISAEQRSMLNEKLLLVNQIVQRAGMDRVGQNVTPEQQRWLLESLYQMPLAQVRGMRPAGSMEGVVQEMNRAKKLAAKAEQPNFGQLSSELVYIPLTPCRFIDTRNVGGPLVGTRAFDLDAAGSTYGGSAACDPSAAVGNNANNIGAVAINVAIVSPTVAPGFIGARPAGATTTTALVNWYQAGASVQASNAGVVTTDQTVVLNDEIEFFGSSTQFIVDMFGLFASPTATALDCTILENTVSIPAGSLGQGISANCAAGRLANGGGCYANSFGSTLVITGNYVMPPLNGWGCDVRNPAGVAQSITARASCCRIPGR